MATAENSRVGVMDRCPDHSTLSTWLSLFITETPNAPSILQRHFTATCCVLWSHKILLLLISWIVLITELHNICMWRIIQTTSQWWYWKCNKRPLLSNKEEETRLWTRGILALLCTTFFYTGKVFYLRGRKSTELRNFLNFNEKWMRNL